MGQNNRGFSRVAGKRRGGFTLIELITVLVIVSILAGLATTAFVVSFQARNADHFVKDLTGYLRLIQAKAIEEGKTYQLTTKEPGGTLSVLVQEEPGAEFHVLENLFSKRFEDPGKFSVRFGQGSGIYFFPDGVMSRNKLMASDEKGERAAIEIKNRIGAFKVTLNE